MTVYSPTANITETVKKDTDREEKEHSDLPPLVRRGGQTRDPENAERFWGKGEVSAIVECRKKEARNNRRFTSTRLRGSRYHTKFQQN